MSEFERVSVITTGVELKFAERHKVFEDFKKLIKDLDTQGKTVIIMVDEFPQAFVVRRKTFRQLFREIKRANMKYPEQHFLIEGQRGMGKTTLLLRLSYEIENDEVLNCWLIPVVLKEYDRSG
jgi:Cdc6-like AAA superfamily ATPase